MKRKVDAVRAFVAGLLFVLAPAMLMFSSQAQAGNVGVHVGINLPLPGVYVAPPPPVYVVREPVVVERVPVVVRERRVVYEDGPEYIECREYRHGHPKCVRKHPKYKRYYHD